MRLDIISLLLILAMHPLAASARQLQTHADLAKARAEWASATGLRTRIGLSIQLADYYSNQLVTHIKYKDSALFFIRQLRFDSEQLRSWPDLITSYVAENQLYQKLRVIRLDAGIDYSTEDPLIA